LRRCDLPQSIRYGAVDTPLCRARCPPQAAEACLARATGDPVSTTTKSREYLYGQSIRYSAKKAKLARQEADKLSCANSKCERIARGDKSLTRLSASRGATLSRKGRGCTVCAA
jgi:hypothetical protein